MLRLPSLSSRSASRLLLSAGVALAAAGGLAVSGISAADAAGGATPLAPAPDGAASGGQVIVVLKHQQTDMNLRTQTSQYMAAVHTEQAPVVSSIDSAGGTDVSQLAAPDAVAANLSADEVSNLRADPSVAEVIPDVSIDTQQVHTESAPPLSPANPVTSNFPAASIFGQGGFGQGGFGHGGFGHGGNGHGGNGHGGNGPGDNGFKPLAPFVTHTIPATCPSKPALEPEAVEDINATNGIPGAPGEANSIATGKGVIIANQGMNDLAGNPDLQRADGSHVVIDAPSYTANDGNDETYEDAASVGAQGLNVYQYSMSLPFSGVSPKCTFVIKGDAPGASLVDLTQIDTPVLALSQVMAGIDAAVTTEHADVISESFGSNSVPGDKALAIADEAAVAAGVTVVESAGDSGPQGTMDSAADDPAVIAAGGIDNFHIVALNDGYTKYQSNQMAAQSSGGVAPTGKVTDLVASDWFGGETACAPLINGCPSNYPVESAAGTSEASPLIAGAAADVIQAYRDTHNGASPTPLQVRSILTGTATPIDAPADEQGEGLLNVYAAVRAAQQMPGTTFRGTDDAPAILPTPNQLDVSGNGRTVSNQPLSLYNPSDKQISVTGSFSKLGPEQQLGQVVTEDVTAPDASLPIPVAGAPAAKTISFTVPKGFDRIDADLIWPDPTNASTLMFDLFNPQGALVQQSYDDGTPGRAGRSPDLQHVEVNDPMPGRWTAVFLWGGDDDYVELAPATPGTYRGPMSFKVSGQNYETTDNAVRPFRIPAHSSVTEQVPVSMPAAPGDTAEFLQLSANNGAALEVPIARRTLIPAAGGSFQANITATTARGQGQVSTFAVNVPTGEPDLNVSFQTADFSPNNIYQYELVDPTGAVVATTSTPQTVDGVASGDAELTTANPIAGTWQIDVILRLTVSGNEFTQTVFGNLSY